LCSKKRKGNEKMSKQPTYKASVVTKRKDKDDFWHSVGGAFAFETKDGRKGIKVPSLNLVLLEPKDGEETAETEAPSTTEETQASPPLLQNS
jgi:hypothetical protein